DHGIGRFRIVAARRHRRCWTRSGRRTDGARFPETISGAARNLSEYRCAERRMVSPKRQLGRRRSLCPAAAGFEGPEFREAVDADDWVFKRVQSSRSTDAVLRGGYPQSCEFSRFGRREQQLPWSGLPASTERNKRGCGRAWRNERSESMELERQGAATVCDVVAGFEFRRNVVVAEQGAGQHGACRITSQCTERIEHHSAASSTGISTDLLDAQSSEPEYDAPFACCCACSSDSIDSICFNSADP